MAIFPAETIGCVIASFLVLRLKDIVSLAKFSLNGLTFFLPPTDDVIESLNAKQSKRAKFPVREKTPQERMQNMVLEYAEIKDNGLLQSTLFYEDYTNLLAVTLSAVLAFAWSELRHCFAGSGSQAISFYGLSAALILTIFYPFHIQFRSGWMGQYEAQVCGAFSLLAIIVALFTIYAPPEVLDMDLDAAFKSIDQRMVLVYSALGLLHDSASSSRQFVFSIRDVWYVLLGTLAGAVTAMYIVPSIRFAKSYSKLIRANDVSWFKKLLLHLNVILPCVVACCWMKPLSESILIRSDAIHCSTGSTNTGTPTTTTLDRDCILDADTGDVIPDPSWIVHSQWRAARLYFVLLTVVIRIVCMKTHLQVFLTEPRNSIIAELYKKGPVDGQVLKEKVRAHFNFLPVVAMQYVTPVLLPFLLCLALKRKAMTTMGVCHGLDNHLAPMLNASWFDPVNLPMVVDNPDTIQFFPFRSALSSSNGSTSPLNPKTMELNGENLLGVLQGLEAYPLITPVAYESFLGFMMLWSNLSWFVLSLLSIVYWRYNPTTTSPALIQQQSRRQDRTTQQRVGSSKKKKQH